MCKISVFLLIAGISLSAVGVEGTFTKMDGGTFIEDKRLFSETVNLKKKKDAADAGETKCMGIIFSSPVIFTSMLCELAVVNKSLWLVEPIKTPAVPVLNVTDGRHMLDFKKIDLEVPGLELVEKNSGDMPIAAPFNQNPDDDMQATAVVFAFGEKMKACAIKILIDGPAECAKLYKGVVTEHPDLGLPAELLPGIYCAVKGEEKMNVTLMSTDDVEKTYEVDVGIPCDDSLGSPVYADRMVYGMVVGAFCGTTKVVLIQPSVKGLSLESYVVSGGPATDTNDGNSTY